MVLVLMTLLAAADERPSDAELLARAEASFAAGLDARRQSARARELFAAAARDYGALHARGYHNADLYRNQGNACLLADDVAGAVLAYRRGLRLAPNDRGLQRGLAAARERVVGPTPAAFGRPPDDDRPQQRNVRPLRAATGPRLSTE